MKKFKLPKVCLSLFDGVPEAVSGGENEAADAGQAEEAPRIVYGRQPEAEDAAEENAQSADKEAGSSAPSQKSAAEGGAGEEESPEKEIEKRRSEFRALVEGRFKNEYTQETQRIIDRRFRRAKEDEDRLRNIAPALETLAKYYGVQDDADFSKIAAAVMQDDKLIKAQAENAGMSSDTYRELQRLQRENAAYKAAQENGERQSRLRQASLRLREEGAALKSKFPQFDLESFAQESGSMAAFLAGQPLEDLYWASHHDELLEAAVAKAQSQAAKSVVDNVRARGSRPVENGAGSQSAAFITKSDPSQLTLADYEEIAKRVRSGERISF